MYLAKPEVPEDTWPPACNEKYINLALVKQEQINFGSEYARVTIRGDIDDVLQHKEMIQFEAIIKELTSGQVLFIEGRPGSGKTTFVHKITQSWATLSNGALRLILLVSLRVLNNLNKRKLDLSDILQLFRDLKVSKRLVEERDGKGVCFIFDGLDEFSPRDGKQSLVYKIINKEYLHQSIVIVASRPAAITKLKRRADKVIETLGFQRRQIFEYFDHFPFSSYSKANELKKYVSCHQNVLHMCYLPIHAAMVSFLFEITGKVPQTETEIYTHFTHFTLVRSFSKNREIDLSDIDVTNLSGEEEILFNQICKLALEKTVLNKQVLQQDEVSSYFKIKKGEDISLGLINIDCTAGLYGFNNLYTFPHLTFQEYLAAYHITTLSDEEQMKILEEHGGKDHMLVVLKFYCGLVEFNQDGQKFKKILEKTRGQSLLHFQCAYESQKQVACEKLLKSTDGCADKYLTTHDFTAIGFVTAKPTVPAKLCLTRCNVNIDAIDSRFHPNITKISFLHLDNITPEPLANVLQFCRNIEELGLINSIGTNELETLNVNLRNYLNLKELDVSGNNLGDDGLTTLATGLKFCQSLERLNISNNSITSSFGTAAVYTSLRHRNLRVKLEDITHRNPISNQAAISSLKHCINLQALHVTLDNPSIGPFVLSSKSWEEIKLLNMCSLFCKADIGLVMASCLPHFKYLKTFTMTNCHVGKLGAIALADHLPHCKNLQLLNLSSNCIEHYGAKALFSSCLQNYTGLLRLNLSANLIGCGVRALSFSPIQSINLQRLDLSENSIGDAGARVLSASLVTCRTNLHILKLHVNNIGDDGAIALSALLKHCHNLEELNLGINVISGNGAKALANNLRHCHQLNKLFLHRNNINIEAMKAVVASLKCCTRLTLLDLCDNHASVA